MLVLVGLAQIYGGEDPWLMGVYLYSILLGLPLMGALLIGTILIAVFEKRLARVYRMVLVCLIAVGIVADALAVAWMRFW